MGKISNSVNLGKNVIDVWQNKSNKLDSSPNTKTRTQDLWKSSTRQLLSSFHDSTTFHGIRFAFGTEISVKRRVIWISLCVLSSCLLVVDVADRIQHYFSYPVSVNLQVNYKESMQFPAVTICNQNSFRRTLAIQNGHYDLLKSLYKDGDSLYLSGEKKRKLSDTWINVTMETLFINNSHRAEDLIVTCKWKGEACTWNDFKPVLTQHGQCYTFLGNTTIEDGNIVDSPGVYSGLELILNIEDYDGMMGPHSSGGVKVILHHETEVPMPEYGNELPSGRHGFMDVQVSKAQNVPPPHGQCVTRSLRFMDIYSYTVGACQMECEMQYISSLCHCRQIHMPMGMSSLPPCNVDQYSTCVVEAKVKYRRLNDVACSCPVPCTQTWYRPNLSYGTISRFSTNQRRVIQNRNIRSRLIYAREMAFREEMDYYTLRRSFVHLNRISLPNFYRVLHDLESVDILLKQSIDTFNYFYDCIQRARKYLEKGHSVYPSYYIYTKRLDKTRLGRDFVDLTSYLDSQIRLMETTDRPEKWTAYYETLQTKVRLDLSAIKEVLKEKDFLDWLSKQYLDVWFADDDQLRSSASPTVYSVPADLQWMEIYKTMNRCKSTLQSYMDIAKTFLKTGKIDLKMLESLNSTSARLAKTFDQQRTQMEVFFKESVVGNFDHVSYVLDVQSQPMTSVISTFEQKCTTMYITMGIRKASIYLNMSVDYLSQYFDRRRTLLTVAEHFDSNHMKYFMEEVRTFASGTFHNKEFSMESTNCLDMLLIEYYAMLKVYELVKPALNGMKIGYYTHKDNAMPSINQLDNYNFDKVELLDVILKLDDVIKIMEEFKQSLKTDQQFYRDNFLHLNILFHELRYEQLTQQIDYTIFALMGDIGGAMGLCIGASALSVFEIIDFITILLASIMVKRKRSSKSHPTVVHVKPKNELNVKPVY